MKGREALRRATARHARSRAIRARLMVTKGAFHEREVAIVHGLLTGKYRPWLVPGRAASAEATLHCAAS
jgi:hypothetical protein